MPGILMFGVVNLQNFYEFDEAGRIEMTLSAIAQRRTLTERWSALNTAESGGWNSRATKAAVLLAGALRVVDFGCGTMALETYLPAGTAYIPVDVVRRDDRTVIIDFNKEPPPAFTADGCACLGLLEYLFDVPSFLTAIARVYPVAVISYNPVDFGDPGLNRRAHGWVNDYDRAGLESVFAQSAWTIEDGVLEGTQQILWRLRSDLHQK